MTEQLTLTQHEIEEAARVAASRIKELVHPHEPKMFAVPRGGVPAAYLIASYLRDATIVESPAEANVIVDDLIDSGGTRDKWRARFPDIPFVALFDKKDMADQWVVFPWEAKEQSADDTIVGTITNRLREAGVPFFGNDNITAHLLPGEMELVEVEVAKRAEHMLAGLLIDVKNDHNTQGTAKRLAKMYCREIFRGRYEAAPKVTDFPNAANLDEMYMTGPLTIRSTCSHHFCPIVGKAWIGILPGTRVVGLSKFNRMVDWICSRPQIQEEMVVQVADMLEKTFAPKGVAVIISATHTCMTWRGVRESAESAMTTSVMRGVFRDNPAARAEFLALSSRS